MDSQDSGATGGWPARDSRPCGNQRCTQRQSSRRSRIVKAIDDQRDPRPARDGSPTANKPTPNGKLYQGPDIRPTKNVPTTSMITSKTTKLPCPVCAKPGGEALATPARRNHVQQDCQREWQGQRAKREESHRNRPSWFRTGTDGRDQRNSLQRRIKTCRGRRIAYSAQDRGRGRLEQIIERRCPAADRTRLENAEQPIRLARDLHQSERTH